MHKAVSVLYAPLEAVSLYVLPGARVLDNACSARIGLAVFLIREKACHIGCGEVNVRHRKELGKRTDIVADLHAFNSAVKTGCELADDFILVNILFNQSRKTAFQNTADHTVKHRSELTAELFVHIAEGEGVIILVSKVCVIEEGIGCLLLEQVEYCIDNVVIIRRSDGIEYTVDDILNGTVLLNRINIAKKLLETRCVLN